MSNGHDVHGIVTLASLLHDGQHLASFEDARRRMRKNAAASSDVIGHLSECVEHTYGLWGVLPDQADVTIAMLTEPMTEDQVRAVRSAPVDTKTFPTSVDTWRLWLRNPNCPSDTLVYYASVGQKETGGWQDVLANEAGWPLADMLSGGAAGLTMLERARGAILSRHGDDEMTLRRTRYYKQRYNEINREVGDPGKKLKAFHAKRKAGYGTPEHWAGEIAWRLADDAVIDAAIGLSAINRKKIDWRPWIRLLAYFRPLFEPYARVASL